MADEESRYWPFAGLKPGECYGPGPKGGSNCRADRWRCKCRKVNRDLSICKCVGVRRRKDGTPSRARKTVRINLRKKRDYQKNYLRPYNRRRGR